MRRTGFAVAIIGLILAFGAMIYAGIRYKGLKEITQVSIEKEIEQAIEINRLENESIDTKIGLFSKTTSSDLVLPVVYFKTAHQLQNAVPENTPIYTYFESDFWRQWVKRIYCAFNEKENKILAYEKVYSIWLYDAEEIESCTPETVYFRKHRKDPKEGSILSLCGIGLGMTVVGICIISKAKEE